MLSADPQVPNARCCVLRKRWRRVRYLLVRKREQPINLAWVESGEAEIEIRLAELLQFDGEEFLVPRCPRHGAIHQQPERFHLRVGPFVAEDRRDCGDIASWPGS